MEWLGYPAVQSYQGLDLSDLPLNHAWVTVNTTMDSVGLYSARDDCFNCPYKLEKHLRANRPESWKVEVSRQTTWRILKAASPDDQHERRNKQGWVCEMRPTFHEYGVYRLDVGKCVVQTEVAPVHTYFPLLLCSLMVLGVCLLYTFIKYMWERRRQQKQDKQEKVLQIQVESYEEETPTLYVFRGIILSLLIFVTTGGGGYPIFNNAWGGLTIAECLFFAFMWSIGVNVPTAMNNALKGKTKCAIIRDIFVRSFILVFLGTLIDSTVERRSIPLWCPLQRMGIAYFFVASFYVLTMQKFEMKSKTINCKALSNVMSLLWCWITSGFLLAILGILISTSISLNCLSIIGLKDPRSDKLHIETEVTSNCNNRYTEYANKLLVGESEKMVNANGYVGFSRGAMGIITTILYMMIGLKAGIIYLQHKSHSDRFKLWTLWATLFGVGGIIFAGVSYPFDFNLWPISSILLLSTSSLYVFSLVYLITEVWKYNSKILSSLGVTSVVVLSGHLLFSHSVPFNWQIYFHSHLVYLMKNVWVVSLWLIVGLLLIRRNVRFEI